MPQRILSCCTLVSGIIQLQIVSFLVLAIENAEYSTLLYLSVSCEASVEVEGTLPLSWTSVLPGLFTTVYGEPIDSKQTGKGNGDSNSQRSCSYQGQQFPKLDSNIVQPENGMQDYVEVVKSFIHHCRMLC